MLLPLDRLPPEPVSEREYLAGPLCFAGDYPQKGVALPPLAGGDYVVFHDTGANSLALWSRHCSRLVPPVYSYTRDAAGEGQMELQKPAEPLEHAPKLALVALGQSVLLCSYTHSALDNVLLKLLDKHVELLRIGPRPKVDGAIGEGGLDLRGGGKLAERPVAEVVQH